MLTLLGCILPTSLLVPGCSVGLHLAEWYHPGEELQAPPLVGKLRNIINHRNCQNLKKKKKVRKSVYSTGICCCSDHSSPLEVRLVTVFKRWHNDLTIFKYLWKLNPDSRSDLHPHLSSTGRCSWFLPRWSGGHLRTARVPADTRNPALPPGRPENHHSSCRNPKQRLNNCQKPIRVSTGVSPPS